MDRLKRNERIAAMAKLLADRPSEVITLSFFCDRFDAAKSTVSEDVELLRDVFQCQGIGQLTTLTGAAGGVVYTPWFTHQQTLEYVRALCALIGQPERVLTGEYIYLTDILSSPVWAERIGCMLGARFAAQKPDFVLTVETSGISIALMTARALGIPMVIARRDSRAYEGSVVTINYKSGSSGQLSTMSLPRRAAREGQRALIVDDFMKAGGTARGLMDLMAEFGIDVVGLGFLLMTREPARKRVEGAQALMLMDAMGEEQEGRQGAKIVPAQWVLECAEEK